ncbi:unnamed protein product [Rotaria sp. Silwood2]|nr:unnamed protein product [Rotaria sp. Silwood2]CAF2577449.1 unnamed protein product [Rotaria sp. Silwood2]CAF2985564.1 unnamed protein product [Rotaria sp. Silwood2]CAF3908992.1 unnamed protein product [Rotaria sp. Silwood2]CAF4114310.1 unnamed protein product [Rotaria sp. Silwood2]
MASKDFIDVNLNCFYSIQMNNEREEDDEIDLTIIQHTSSMDSLEQNESNIQNLRFISGCHKWINTNNNNNIRVEKSYMINNDNENLIHEKTFSINNKNINDIEDDENTCNSNQTDLSLNHFDVQLQVTNGQLEQATRYGVFSSLLSKDLSLVKLDQYSQTIEPEMDMDNRDGNNNYYTKQYNGNGNENGNTNNNYNNNNNDGSYRRNQQTNGSSGNGGNGNGSNPNRNNNNNPRRPNDDGSGDNGDDEDENETDESLVRRLGFRPIDNEIIRLIGRIRRLTNKQSFDQRDFENMQYLIDELIRLQHLENSSQEHLEKIIHHLKLYRVLRSKSHALQFIQDRLPRRTTKSNNDNNSNVFDIWRERERRARLDSKDSLEDEGQNISGQQSQDKIEFNYSTSPTIHSNNSNNKSKVKQMARHIDTKSGSSCTGGDYVVRSSSPSPINQNQASDRLYSEAFIEDRSRTRKHVSPISSSEQRRVRQMVDRLESSSTSSANPRVEKTLPTTKSYHEEYSNTSRNVTSSPNVKRITRRENQEYSVRNGSNGSFGFRQRSPREDIHIRDNNSNMRRYEIGRNEPMNSGRHTTSGTQMDEYPTSVIPGAETSVSMVRDIRTRFYDDDSTLSRTYHDNIPVKVDVETLYILEQKSVPPTTNIYTPDYGYNRSSTLDRHDFAAQTTIPIVNIKPSNRPIGTQVNSTIEQNTVSAQTTDSLHRPIRERQCLTVGSIDNDEASELIRTKTTTTTTKYEVKRRHSSHHTSEDEDDGGTTTIVYTDDKENYQAITQPPIDDKIKEISDRTSYTQVSSHERTDQISDTNRNVVRRHIEQHDYNENEHHSLEVYEIHNRGACKCLVVSYEEKTQYGSETRFERQLQRIERTYTDEDLKSTELHVIVTTSDESYQLVRREYSLNKYNEEEKTYDKTRYPSIAINYYTKDGVRMRTEQSRNLENLPLFIRCEIEYELNHYGSAQLIILSVTNAERRQMNISTKKEIVDETISRLAGRLPPNSPELENEISRQLTEQISLLHLVDYSSRDDYNQTNSTDLRRVSRNDVITSLRIVQRYRTIIHRLCHLYRSHLRLTTQAEQQRYLILVARDDYYLLDLVSQTANIPTSKYDIQQDEVFQREVHPVPQEPFDYAKYRRDIEQQQRILEQHYRKMQNVPPPQEQSSEAEFYLGSGRRALIEREIHSMRESIRPHEHAPPRYKHEPSRRSLSISYTGGQRYVRARIIHVKDFYDANQQEQEQQPQNAKEQELFVRVDDYINESAANTLRRSYSTDYLQEDGPRSRIRYMRIPGETIRIEEKTTYEYNGVMYADLPYALKYWNILYILDREAREGRPLGSSLPQVIVNDPYRTVIPPLTQQEIRATAQQVLSPQYYPRSHTDQTLRWFLSRDKRTEIESAKYLQALNHYRQQQQQYQQQLQKQQLLQQQQQQEQLYQQQLLQQQRQQYEQQLLQQQQQQQQQQQYEQQLLQQQLLQQPQYEQQILQPLQYEQEILQIPQYEQQILQPPQYEQQILQPPQYEQQILQPPQYEQQLLLQRQQQYEQQLLQQPQYEQHLLQQQYEQQLLQQPQYEPQLQQQQYQQRILHQQKLPPYYQQQQANVSVHDGKIGVAKKYYVTEKIVHYKKLPDRFVPVVVNDRAQSIDNIHHRSPSATRMVRESFHSQKQLHHSHNEIQRSQSQPRHEYQPSPSTFTSDVRTQLPSSYAPLSRHHSVHELHIASTSSRAPSPSPSLHSLHSNYQSQHHRRPVAFNTRYQTRYPTQRPMQQQHQNALLTEIIDSGTGQMILTTGQEQLPTEVLGLLNKYNLQ